MSPRHLVDRHTGHQRFRNNPALERIRPSPLTRRMTMTSIRPVSSIWCSICLTNAFFRDAPSSTKAMAKSRRDMRPSFTRPDCLRKSEGAASSRVILTVIPTSKSVGAIESDFHEIGNPKRVTPSSRWYQTRIAVREQRHDMPPLRGHH